MKKDNMPEELQDNGQNPVNPQETDEVLQTAEDMPEESTETTEETTDSTETDTLLAEVLKEETEKDSSDDKKGKKEKVKKKSFNKRKFRFGAMSTTITVVVIAAVILLNVIVGIINDRYPLNWDLTNDKLYTLSDESVEFAKSIKDDVKITVFIPEEVLTSSTTEQGKIFMQFHEALTQYEKHSGGKVTAEYVDLTKDPTKASKYEKYGVEYGSVLFTAGGANGKAEKFKAITVNDLATSETDYQTYQTTYDSNVETVMAAKISSITSGKNMTMAVFSGHDEDSSTLSSLKSLYSSYELIDVDLSTNVKMPEDCNTAIIAAPSADYTDAELTRLRSWLNNNGKLNRNLVVLVNANVTKDKMKNLYGFLNVEYGIEVTDNIIAETDSKRMFDIRLPYMIQGDIGESDYTKDLKGNMLLANMVHQLNSSWGTDTQNSQYCIPLMTFPESAKLINLVEAGDDANKDKTFEDLMKPADGYPISGMLLARNWTYDNDTDGNPVIANNILVTTNTMMDTSMQLRDTIANTELAEKLMNFMTGNENAVSISSKSVKQESLGFSAGVQAWLGIGVFTVGIPAITLIICLIVFVKRRNL